MLHAVENQTDIDKSSAKRRKLMSVCIDQDEFLVDQDEAQTFESIPELDSRNKPRYSLGTFSVNGQETPVYCLSDELALIDHIPEGRESCVVLRKGNLKIGLLCREFKDLDYIMFNIHNMPECMAQSASPISALCVYQLKDSIPAIGKMLTADAIDSYIRLY